MLSIKYFVKIFVITLASIILIIGGFLGFTVSNQTKIANWLTQNLGQQLPINFSYSNYYFSITKHFPNATFILNDVKIQYPSSSDTLLITHKLHVSINALSLINGDYQINSIDLKQGKIKFDVLQFQNLQRLFVGDNERDTISNFAIRFDGITLNDIEVDYVPAGRINKQSFTIDNAIVQVNILPNNSILQFRTNISQLLPINLKNNKPIKIEGIIKESENQINVSTLNVDAGFALFSAKGIYNTNSLSGELNFWSNNMSLKRVVRILKVPQIVNGTSSINGFLKIDKDGIYSTSINHVSSNVEVEIEKGFNLKINRLEGRTTFTENFSNQYTEFKQVDVSQANNRVTGSAKVKGINKMALLADLSFTVTDLSKFEVFEGYDMAANGNAKILAGINSTNGSVSVKLEKIKAQSDFLLNSNPLFPELKQIKASANIGGDVKIDLLGSLYSKPITAKINLINSLNIINNKSINSIYTSINTSFINVDKLLNDIANKTFNSSNSALNIDYNVNFKLDTVFFSEKKFTNASGNLSESGDTITLHNLKANLYSGTTNCNVSIHNNGYHIIGNINNVNVSNLFADNNNFGQSFINHTNISGKLNSNFNLYLKTINGEINTNSLLLNGNFILSDGKLRGMNKVKQLEKWLNLDEVESIDFSTLQNTIQIANGEILIPTMTIKSNVISIVLDGKHNFNGNFEYRTKLNLSRLLAARFMNKNAASDFEQDQQHNHFINLLISGNSNNYRIKRDRERANQQIKNSVNTEKEAFKNIVREEFGLKPDTSTQPSTTTNNSGFRIEWEEDDFND